MAENGSSPPAPVSDMDIAIIGYAFKLPQDVEDEVSLWETLENRRNLMTEWPKSKVNLEDFYDGDKSRPNTVSESSHSPRFDPASLLRTLLARGPS